MFGEAAIGAKRSLARELLVAVVALVFVVAFASIASAYSSDIPFTYTGKIVAIDRAGGFVTVQAASGHSQIFKLGEGASFTQCDQSLSWNDMKIGSDVTVSYYEDSTNNLVADNVSVSLPMMEHCS